MGCSTRVWVHLLFSLSACGESYAGYLSPCFDLGSNGAAMASPFFPEFPGTEHWPGVGEHTADVVASQNVAVSPASQSSEPLGTSF